MRRRFTPLLLLVLLVACGGSDPAPGAPPDPRMEAGTTIADAAATEADGARAPSEGGTPSDAAPDAESSGEAGSDAAVTACAWRGAPGQCLSTEACAKMPDHTPYAGQCPGPADIQCCIKTPNVADNPPVPAGYKLMAQAQVTPEMTTWAVAILNDTVTYPLFATATKTFGTTMVLARVEWHPPDFQNNVVHRGVTLYVPT